MIILQFTNYKISNKRCAAAITSSVFKRVYQCRGNIKQTRYGIFKNNKNKCNVKWYFRCKKCTIKFRLFMFLVIVMWFSKGLDKYTFLFVLFIIHKEDKSSIRMWEKRSEVKLSVNKSSIGKPFKRLPFYGNKDRCFYYILVIDFQLLIKVSVFAKIGLSLWKIN